MKQKIKGVKTIITSFNRTSASEEEVLSKEVNSSEVKILHVDLSIVQRLEQRSTGLPFSSALASVLITVEDSQILVPSLSLKMPLCKAFCFCTALHWHHCDTNDAIHSSLTSN